MAEISTKRINIQYYALLREERGAPSETWETAAVTPQELYEELRRKYGFTLDAHRLSVAVNDEFAKWDRQIADNDKIVFVPPVAGG